MLVPFRICLKSNVFQAPPSLTRKALPIQLQWYETAAQCIKKINTLRPIAPFLVDGILGQLQDVADWKIVLELAKNEKFWIWVACFNKFTKRAEKFRSWGNGCLCHEADFARRVAVVSDRLSRRLAEAFDYVNSFLDGLVGWVNGLTVRDCEGDANLCQEICFVVRRFVPEARAKYRFAGDVPYIVSNISVPRFAQRFVEQYNGAPRADHHRNPISIADSFLPDIIKIANGDIASIPESLKAEQEVYRRIPLSSSRAEGYHRTTRLSKIRGASSKVPWILSSCRLNQNLDVIEDMIEDTELGGQCFEAEFRSFSRVLQTRNGCKPCKRIGVTLYIEIEITPKYVKTY